MDPVLPVRVPAWRRRFTYAEAGRAKTRVRFADAQLSAPLPNDRTTCRALKHALRRCTRPSANAMSWWLDVRTLRSIGTSRARIIARSSRLCTSLRTSAIVSRRWWSPPLGVAHPVISTEQLPMLSRPAALWRSASGSPAVPNTAQRRRLRKLETPVCHADARLLAVGPALATSLRLLQTGLNLARHHFL